MRRDARRDDNEPSLIRIAKQFGALWVQAPPLDGWIRFRECWTPVEIKNPDGRNRYTPAQVKFLALCKEQGVPVWTWRSNLDVFESLGAEVSA